MKAFFLLILCQLLSVVAAAQPDDWTFACAFGAPTEVADVATDEDGNYYITGRFSGSLQLGNTRLTSAGPSLYIAKYRPGGQLLRVTQLSATTDVQPRGIAVDDDGNCYVTGSFRGTLRAVCSPWAPIALTAAGTSDVFVLRCGPLGIVRWIRQATGSSLGSGSICYGEGVALDAAGNCYLTGQVSGIEVLFGSVRVANTTLNSAFLASYSAQGALRWARIWRNTGLSSISRGGGIALASGNTGYLSGIFNGVWTLDNVTMSAMPGGLFLAQFDSRQGRLAWSISPAALTSGSGRAVATDRRGRVYLGGGFFGSFGSSGPASQGSSDAFVARYTAQGTLEQVVPLGGGGADAINDIATEPNSGKVFATGSITSAQAPREQAFLARIQPNGRVQALEKVTGPGSGIGLCLAIDERENIYTTGAFTGNCRFGSFVLNGGASQQGYFARYGRAFCPVPPAPADAPTLALDVFPNPANHQLTLHLPAGQAGVRATLYDARGQVVAEHTAAPGQAPADLQFGTATLPEGQYTLRIAQEQQQVRTRQISIRH
ncbi:SBBP repeat-containing protein [Microvirga sp. STR05]|uniref:SBBP repeat-containing protein n=1 Tax=Hymenobacter duratus TaxID=2771356 RepID=A0ABR8JIK8_9BACT|nr:SBBP repeat-containing protein [Hymenobacter duratus]MBD2715187.1 SBBP repeat-containing protein [Hymenobacter duratus]MBR7950094.1 SBBP repeat-containing protein [Microvirga sp. STR05]